MTRRETREYFLTLLQQQGITTITRQELYRLCRMHDLSIPQWFLRDRQYKHPTLRGVFLVPQDASPSALVKVGESVIHKMEYQS